MPASTHLRITVAGIFLVLFAALLLMRLFFVQVIQADEYLAKADRQYTISAGGEFSRGAIYFTEKNKTQVSAATLKTGFTLAINPTVLPDSEVAYEALHPFISDIEKDIFLAKATKGDDPYEELAHRIPEETAQKIQALDMPGVILVRERWRFYPAGKTAAHVLGFVGYAGDKIEGRYGLEQYYNDVLAREGSTADKNFFAQLFDQARQLGNDNRAGDLKLTIEPKVQLFLEQKLGEVENSWHSDSIGGIIMNPKTGAIYAMAALPTFDPNNFRSANESSFPNPLVQSVYEMGSVMKPLTMAAALDAGVVTPKTTYNDQGIVKVGIAEIKNFDGKGRGVVDMQTVLNKSLNTGMVFVASRLGNQKVRDYLLKYGIGSETGIDVPGEVKGLVDNLDSNRDVEYATAAFGQGIAVTPIEAIRAFSALGNGGVLPDPYIVDDVDYVASGHKKHYPNNEGTRVLKQATSEEITRMLVNLVDNALLNGTVKMDHYSIAAKTGTAQISNPATGKYYEDRYFHSFFGYFPAYNPEFIIFLYNGHPKGAQYASETLTLPFMDIAKFLINYYEIAPDR